MARRRSYTPRPEPELEESKLEADRDPEEQRETEAELTELDTAARRADHEAWVKSELEKGKHHPSYHSSVPDRPCPNCEPKLVPFEQLPKE